MRLDDDVIAVGANRRGRADVDALRAAFLFRTAVRANRRLVVEELRLFEFAFQRRDFSSGPRLGRSIVARREIPLRGVTAGEPRFAAQIEHRIEIRLPFRIASIEVDRTDRSAGGHALPVIATALEIDLIAPVDRVLRTGANACVAPGAYVEVDRVVLRPFSVERAEPAG